MDTTVGSASQFVVSAHLNRDTYPDLVVCNTSDDSISVLINNGAGGFSKTTYQTGSKSRPIRAAVGDFNGDTFNDIAVLHASGGTISIFSSLAVPGTFNPVPTKVNAGSMTVGVTAGKTGSGPLSPTDILATNQDASNVVLMRNSGAGIFSGPQAYPTGTMPQSIALGDFDGDGVLDVATGNMAKRNVSVLRGKGDRTFHAAQNSSTIDFAGYNVVPVFLAGDNKLDLVAPNVGKGGAIVLYGNGDGTFQPPLLLPGGTQSYAVATGDLNSDGHPDLVTANFGSGDISVFMADGQGGFDPAIVIPVTPASSVYVNWVTVADLNHDGLDDVAVTLSTGHVRVLMNTSVFVSSVTPERNSISVGSFTTGTVTLSGKAPEGGAIIDLTVSDPGNPVVSVPPSITVPAGQTSVSFDIVGRRVGSAALTATFNGLHKSVSLTVTSGGTPPPPPPPPPGLNGDLDGDGRLTLNDVVKLLRIVGGEDDAGA